MNERHLDAEYETQEAIHDHAMGEHLRPKSKGTFVQITQLEMEAILKNFVKVQLSGTKELVYQIGYTNPNLKNIVLRVYSSIDPSGLGRDCGDDAIRCVLFDLELNKPIGCSKRTNRTMNWQANLLDKARDLYASIKMYKCKCCKHFMVERNGRNGKFLGCTNYPNCKHTEELDKDIIQYRK